MHTPWGSRGFAAREAIRHREVPPEHLRALETLYDGESEPAALEAWRGWQRPAGSLPTTRYWVDLTEHVPAERTTLIDPTNLRGTKTRHP